DIPIVEIGALKVETVVGIPQVNVVLSTAHVVSLASNLSLNCAVVRLNMKNPTLNVNIWTKASSPRCFLLQWTLSVAFLFCVGFSFLILVVEAFLHASDSSGGTTWAMSPSECIHYAVMVDAGSSGSRVYLYCWPEHSGVRHHLLDIRALKNPETKEPLHKRLTPGLSTYGSDPSKAMDYISPLLNFAMENIPKEKHLETSLYILATAGMRLLPQKQQDAIFEVLRTEIPKKYPFHFPSSNVETIGGKQEGFFQWLAINYAMGTLGRFVTRGPIKQSLRRPTVGIMDMGGASMQIAFEVPPEEPSEEVLRDNDKEAQLMEVNIGAFDDDPTLIYRVYVTTFLGFGANEKLAHYQEVIVSQASKKNASEVPGTLESNPLPSACLPKNLLDSVDLQTSEFLPGKPPKSTVYFRGLGNFTACLLSLKSLTGYSRRELDCAEGLNQNTEKNSITPKPNCDFASRMHPPPMLDVTAAKFYGFSEFWYSLDDVLHLGGQYDSQLLKNTMENFCSTDWSHIWAQFKNNSYPLADEHRMRYQCFKAAWIMTALHEGMKFPYHYSQLYTSPYTIEGTTVGWPLGALLHKTRYFPVRAINQLEQANHHIHTHALNPYWSFRLHNSFLLLCIILVVLAIVIYIRRLLGRPKKGLLHVPSHFTLIDDEDSRVVIQSY
ncbi:unnamed protein product, partial [Darwinula stevensoni]